MIQPVDLRPPTSDEISKVRRSKRIGSLLGLGLALIVIGWVLVEAWH